MTIGAGGFVAVNTMFGYTVRRRTSGGQEPVGGGDTRATGGAVVPAEQKSTGTHEPAPQEWGFRVDGPSRRRGAR